MKKEIIAIALVALLLVGGGFYYFLDRSARPPMRAYREAPPIPKELRQMEKQMAAAALPAEPPKDKQALTAAEVPAEILKAVHNLLPNATVTEATRDKKDKFKLKLATGGAKTSASLRLSDQGVRGSLKENLEPSALPPAIAEAFKRAMPDGVIKNLEKTTEIGGEENGQVVYEWECGKNAKAEASADGTLLRITEEVAATDLPAAVTEAIARTYPQSTLDKKADRINENGQVTYVVDVRPVEGKKREVTMRENGEILK